MPPIQNGAPIIHPNDLHDTSIKTAPYLNNPAHLDHITFRRNRLRFARDQRDMSDYRFDDMTFVQWWDKNDRADNSYIKPRVQKGDTEINMGIVRDKVNTLLSLSLKYDYEPAAQCYDDSNEMLQELAEESEDLVRKSLHIEEFTEKAKHIHRGMLTYSTQLVEEVYLERWGMEKELSGHVGEASATWTERLTKLFDGCIAKPWDLRKCYPGDKNRQYMNGPLGQPFFYTAEYINYNDAKAIYGSWDLWECVPKTVTYTPEAQSAAAPQTFQSAWTLSPTNVNQCEVIKYYDPIANEFAIIINGIDMLPVMTRTKSINGVATQYVSGFPLTAISPSGAIPFSKFDMEPINGFFYGKSIPSKTRVIADVEDMVVKLMIIGMKQMRKPPKGYRGDRVPTGDIYIPGQITNDIREGELFDLLPNQQGIQPAEFSFYEAIKKGRDEISTTRGFSGTGEQADTATQAVQDKEQQLDKVALMLDGLMKGYSQLFWLRTYNIYANWTKPIDKEIDTARKEIVSLYRSVSIQKEIDGNNKGMKIVRFTTKAVPGNTKKEQSQFLHKQELDLSKEKRTDVRLTIMNPEILRQMKLNWYYQVTPVAKNNDSMAQMMFAKAINDAITFFGPQSLNVARLKRRYAMKYNQDYEEFFLGDDAVASLEQQQAQAQMQMQNPGQKGSPTIASTAQKRSPQLGTVMK